MTARNFTWYAAFAVVVGFVCALLTACGGASVDTPAPADECIDAGVLMHDAHEGMLVRVPHPPGSGQVYDADGARVEVVGPVQAYATLRLTDVRDSTVLLRVHAFDGGDVLCVEVERL
jgi:hypothetical protein